MWRKYKWGCGMIEYNWELLLWTLFCLFGGLMMGYQIAIEEHDW